MALVITQLKILLNTLKENNFDTEAEKIQELLLIRMPLWHVSPLVFPLMLSACLCRLFCRLPKLCLSLSKNPP